MLDAVENSDPVYSETPESRVGRGTARGSIVLHAFGRLRRRSCPRTRVRVRASRRPDL